MPDGDVVIDDEHALCSHAGWRVIACDVFGFHGKLPVSCQASDDRLLRE